MSNACVYAAVALGLTLASGCAASAEPTTESSCEEVSDDWLRLVNLDSSISIVHAGAVQIPEHAGDDPWYAIAGRKCGRMAGASGIVHWFSSAGPSVSGATLERYLEHGRFGDGGILAADSNVFFRLNPAIPVKEDAFGPKTDDYLLAADACLRELEKRTAEPVCTQMPTIPAIGSLSTVDPAVIAMRGSDASLAAEATKAQVGFEAVGTATAHRLTDVAPGVAAVGIATPSPAQIYAQSARDSIRWSESILEEMAQELETRAVDEAYLPPESRQRLAGAPAGMLRLAYSIRLDRGIPEGADDLAAALYQVARVHEAGYEQLGDALAHGGVFRWEQVRQWSGQAVWLTEIAQDELDEFVSAQGGE